MSCIALGSDFFGRLLEGLCLPHPYGILHLAAEFGLRATLKQQVTIGAAVGRSGPGVPRLRSGVLVGAGAKISPPVVIGDKAMVGGNEVVARDVPEGARVVGVNRTLVSAAGPVPSE